MSNHKGYILQCIVGQGIPNSFYIPESEELGPIGLTLGDDSNPITFFEGDQSSELACKNGESAGYKRVGEVDVPQEIIDLINSHRNYIETNESAKPVLKKILVSNE